MTLVVRIYGNGGHPLPALIFTDCLRLFASDPFPAPGRGAGGIGSPRRALHLAHEREQLFEIGQATFENLRAADDPLTINHEDRPLAEPVIGSPEAIRL